jgi:hypothetical protein
MANTSDSVPRCPVCDEPMHLRKTLPGLGGLPEVHTFECRRCRQILSLEFDKIRGFLPSIRPA